jgi:hypothetical protein
MPEVEEELQQRISTYDIRLERKILELLKTDPYTALASAEYGINCSHTIFMMRPRKVKKYDYVSNISVIDLATPHIGNRIGAATADAALKGAQLMYQFLLGQAETKTSAGWVFEARMHLVFQRGGRFEATKLGGSTPFAIEIGDKPHHHFSKVSELGSILRKASGSPSIDSANIGGYFKQHCNFCAVGSFAITTLAATKEPVLVLFQMTVSTLHPVKAHGLASIWAEIPAELKRTPSTLVFVLPVGAVNKFSRQTIVPSGTITPNFDKWKQYVLPVSAETLWENTAPDCEVLRKVQFTRSKRA